MKKKPESDRGKEDKPATWSDLLKEAAEVSEPTDNYNSLKNEVIGLVADVYKKPPTADDVKQIRSKVEEKRKEKPT